MDQRIILSTDLEAELTASIQDCEHDKIFVLTDTTTHSLCLPLVKDFPCLRDASVITIGSTDVEKTLALPMCGGACNRAVPRATRSL